MAKTEEKTKQENALIAGNMLMNGTGIEIRTLQDAKLVAETFIASGLVPKHFNIPSKVIVAIQAGFELGFKPWQALNNLHVVNGQVGIKSTAIGGLIRSRGRCKSMKQFYEGEKGKPERKAIVESQRVDDTVTHRTEFSLNDAKIAGLLGKDNWNHYPEDMLMWRALSRHGRAFYGDVLSGFYTVEELQEICPPQESPTPQVPSREERKQANEVKVTDTKQLVKEELEKCLTKFIGCAEYGIDTKLDTVPKPVILQAFAKFVGGALQDKETDYTKPESYTINNIAVVGTELELNGVPKDILALIPVPESMTMEEVEKEAEDKFGHEYKYKCISEKCGAAFDEPKKGTRGIKLCPKCLSKNVIDLTKKEGTEAKK